MQPDDRNRFESEYVRQWWEITRRYLFADLGGGDAATDRTHAPPCPLATP
jgi:hypothetical protein